ncbi:hypothetical protein BDZ45DRAFT_671593 [Acephala macrosclerotiorum]|nr:hypothetical protein BDZ45DRAFT_671593 [Acephala macrosclerotiorum]
MASLTDAWLQDVRNHGEENTLENPNYYATSPQLLITTSTPLGFEIGTGNHIFSQAIPKCARANHEVIIVTCFWAKSSSQEALVSLLLGLSDKGASHKRKIQVRVCFSSSSIFQKLSQTSSLDGKIYPPSSWTKLGLPPPEKLKGIELVVKSVFVLPFSVMHPKFILIDRKLAFMPSCNISWENWFEGCVEIKGEITKTLFHFWNSFWSRGGAALPPLPKDNKDFASSADSDTSNRPFVQAAPFSSKDEEIPTILLPSPHHVNPRFQPFTKSAPPPTPLNLFILNIFSHAKRNIYLQTPNLTSQPVINAVFSAIERGIHVYIITSNRLMILEQLATAGTITEYEVWKLLRRYRRLLQQYNQSLPTSDPENPKLEPGVLRIGYYQPRVGVESAEEPVKSHLKCVIMDEEVVVLGSGNMDRASWYTSQELGVALFSAEFAGYVTGVIHEGLKERVRYVC